MVNLEKKIFPNYAYKSLLLNLNLKFKLLPCCSDGKMFSCLLFSPGKPDIRICNTDERSWKSPCEEQETLK